MEFTDNIFLLFIIAFYLFYLAASGLGAGLPLRNQIIGMASLVFYGAWYPPAVLLILGHALLAQLIGPAVRRRQTWALVAGVAISLAVLFVFKYYNFFVGLIGHEGWVRDIILPVGISFYTFTIIGYYVDLWRQEIEAERRFGYLVLFLAFWPHLAAGPVLRAKNIFHNIHEREPLTLHNAALAVALLVSGLFKKFVLADNIGAYVNANVSAGIDGMSGLEAGMTVVGFGAQIYADFSGYSDMAIGFALLLGFRLPANFNYPYLARSLAEFWRRWHISLSTWFRDYLYIPLGGNRHGPWRGYFNVFLVFLLSGIWHGAGINFAVWGMIHGLFLIVERLLGRHWQRLYGGLRWLIVYLVVNVAWAFFFLEHQDALAILGKVVTVARWAGEATSPYHVAAIALMLLILALDHAVRLYRVNREGFPVLAGGWHVPLLLVVMVVTAIVFNGHALPFIYFEF